MTDKHATPATNLMRETFNAGYCYGVEHDVSPEELDSAWVIYQNSGRFPVAATPAQDEHDTPDTPSLRESDKVEYLIWSGEHNAYWMPDASGYSCRIRDAGRYSLEDAKRRTSHC